ncbi:beta-galactosidase [Mariniflexile sp. AS56]|uniref:beta-galactosidase n=1 Tax=Mariniflexile sp. AS56 TaxID=3063957 RepID=UPI0026EFD0D0|nr:beta-galactosidase [Mariniflexile sp. AS56]MDO7173155.1 beta-galactosidase [Mariniflexile sp. AS56]
MKKLVFVLFTALSFIGNSQPLEVAAKQKIDVLEKLIIKAEKQGLDVLKEKMTVRTAEIFLKYANWDEKNVKENTGYFKKVQRYKNNAEEMATLLAGFERMEVSMMLDEATDYITLLLEKKVFRTPSPQVDWAKVTQDGDQLTYNNRPVFLSDYTWKPRVPELTKFHGNQDGFLLTPSQVINEKGDLNPNTKKDLYSKPNGTLGFIFLNHKTVPKWAKAKYGDDFAIREDTYTAYDIDNPGAREIQKLLLGSTVPQMAGKQYTKLGYMLCNEPHFFTQKVDDKISWASGPVSNYTKEKFKIWLENKHKTIDQLNAVWNTDFASFKDVSIEIPIDVSLRGTAKWYDWSLFNMNRVTEWYSFLKTEIQKHDPAANVHLKIMPNLWTENERIHGIDLEELTQLSGIIGNDSGAENNHMWGPKEEWEDHYAFNWRELCMGFDFMKSVSPDKINFNSELHYLSTTKSRDLYLDPMYARATFWLAHTYGMTASQTWFWARNEDGSVKSKGEKGYAASNNQQPRIVNEVASTIIDLNAHSEDIMALQRLKKPLRVFHSKTSAINKKKHMDDEFELYESLHFEGIPIGFATKNILNEQDNSNWNAVLIHKTEFVTDSELKAIQNYLNNGGTVIMDDVRLVKDEYGNPLPKLNQAKGTLIRANSLETFKEEAFKVLQIENLLPEVSVTETNETGVKGCAWKVAKNNKGNYILSVVNIGKTNASLNISLKGVQKIVCKDIINGVVVSSSPILKPNEVYFVEVSK